MRPIRPFSVNPLLSLLAVLPEGSPHDHRQPQPPSSGPASVPNGRSHRTSLPDRRRTLDVESDIRQRLLPDQPSHGASTVQGHSHERITTDALEALDAEFFGVAVAERIDAGGERGDRRRQRPRRRRPDPLGAPLRRRELRRRSGPPPGTQGDRDRLDPAERRPGRARGARPGPALDPGLLRAQQLDEQQRGHEPRPRRRRTPAPEHARHQRSRRGERRADDRCSPAATTTARIASPPTRSRTGTRTGTAARSTACRSWTSGSASTATATIPTSRRSSLQHELAASLRSKRRRSTSARSPTRSPRSRSACCSERDRRSASSSTPPTAWGRSSRRSGPPRPSW